MGEEGPTNPVTERESSAHVSLYLRLILIALLVLILIQAYNYWTNQPQVIAGLGNYAAYSSPTGSPFTVARLALFSGGYRATSTVDFIVLTAAEYVNWTAGNRNVTPDSYEYRALGVLFDSFRVILPAGEHYFLFFKDNSASSTTVSVTEAFVLTPT
jgi:hypothetical protein